MLISIDKINTIKMDNLHLETFKAEAQGNGWPTKVHIPNTE